MARFYVGQRVRIVSCDDPIDKEAMALVGREAIVNELDCINENGKKGHIGLTVDGDPDWVFWPHEIEPITDSYDVASWDTCIWKPEHLRVKV